MAIYVTDILRSYYGYPTVRVRYYMVSGSYPARVRLVSGSCLTRVRRVNDGEINGVSMIEMGAESDSAVKEERKIRGTKVH